MAVYNAKVPIQSTAGAIPTRNEKGDLTMEKVKVQRYVSGKRPDYAPQDSSDEDEEFFGFQQKKQAVGLPAVKTDAEKEDRRLRRLRNRHEDEEEDEDIEDRIMRRRRLHEPEVLSNSEEEEEAEETRRPVAMDTDEGSDEEEEEDLDEEEIERRRMLLRQKAQQHSRQEDEVLEKEEEKSDEGSEEEESSEYEEYTDSEEEEIGPRLKPVFVRKKDRVTIQEKEREELRQKELELEGKKVAEERRRYTLKLVEDEARKEMEETRGEEAFDAVNTDDDNDEEEYEAWKVRELKRLKRDREERETIEKEKQEIDRLHNMTEEERRNELKANPKTITNKANKGKYKFLQKYYHRGAFFMDHEEGVLKRDFAQPTLEDHFDKTILPKVMQVKNFGRSGRTKYTHLVDQDTTAFDSPWMDTAISHKFHSVKGGGMKQNFEKPSIKKKQTVAQ